MHGYVPSDDSAVFVGMVSYIACAISWCVWVVWNVCSYRYIYIYMSLGGWVGVGVYVTVHACEIVLCIFYESGELDKQYIEAVA